MASGHPLSDLGRWHHGDSSSVTCADCEQELGSGLSDGAARRLARAHARLVRHHVEIERCYYQVVYPPRIEPAAE